MWVCLRSREGERRRGTLCDCLLARTTSASGTSSEYAERARESQLVSQSYRYSCQSRCEGNRGNFCLCWALRARRGTKRGRGTSGDGLDLAKLADRLDPEYVASMLIRKRYWRCIERHDAAVRVPRLTHVSERVSTAASLPLGPVHELAHKPSVDRYLTIAFIVVKRTYLFLRRASPTF